MTKDLIVVMASNVVVEVALVVSFFLLSPLRFLRLALRSCAVLLVS